MSDRGSVALEATLVLPIFIFFVIGTYHMCCSRLADNCIYEAAVETAEYMAEYAYLDENNLFIPSYKFEDYIDDDTLVGRYVEGGISGISFLGTNSLDDEGYVVLCVQYTDSISVPFMPTLKKTHSFTIRQRAYVGARYDTTLEDMDGDSYVYITDNRDVYHSTRLCTYLELSIRASSVEAAENDGYTACEICGYGNEKIVYVTDYGKRYHCDTLCSGLKRTVYRVRLSEVKALGGCSRCVR